MSENNLYLNKKRLSEDVTQYLLLLNLSYKCVWNGPKKARFGMKYIFIYDNNVFSSFVAHKLMWKYD